MNSQPNIQSGHLYGQAAENSKGPMGATDSLGKTSNYRIALTVLALLLVIANTGLLINLTVKDDADTVNEALAPVVEVQETEREFLNVTGVDRRDYIYLIQGSEAKLSDSGNALTVYVDGPIIAIPDDVTEGMSRLHHFDTPRKHVEANPAGPDFYASRPDATLFYTAIDGVQRRTRVILGAATWSGGNPESITFSDVEFIGPTLFTSKTIPDVDSDVAESHLRAGVSGLAIEVQLQGVAECGVDPADEESCKGRNSNWPVSTRIRYLLHYESHGVSYSCGDTWYWDSAPYPIPGSTESYPQIGNAWHGCRIATDAGWQQFSVFLHRGEWRYKTVRRARVPSEGPPRGYHECPSAGCIDINSDCRCDQRCDHNWADFRPDKGCSFQPRMRDLYFVNDAEGHQTCAEIGGRQLSDYHECVYMPPDQLDWFAAKRWCQDDGGKLAEVYDRAENNQLKDLLVDAGASSMWIGAEDFATEGQFVHASSGERQAYGVWAYGEPNNYGTYYGEDCVEMRGWGTVGEWNDAPCLSKRQRFACQKPTTPAQIQQVVNWLRNDFAREYRRRTPGGGGGGR